MQGEDEFARELSERPNSTVYKTVYDSTKEPWRGSEARRVAEHIASRTTTFGDDVSDFALRKTVLAESDDILAFQRQHPKMYHLLTDRKMVADTRFRSALSAMLCIRDKVDSGSMKDGKEADALATSGIMRALNVDMSKLG